MSLTKVSYAMITGAPFNVLDYGAKGDGVTDDTAAFLAAVAAVQANRTLYGGGVLYIPSGHYIIKQTLQFTSGTGTDSSGHNVFIVGEGPYNTTLDFSGASAGSNGIQFGNGGNFGIEKLFVTGAPRSGIFLGDVPSSSNNCFEFVIEQVQVKNCGNHGIESPYSYLGTIRDCWSLSNTGSGISLQGFHTSLDISRTECGNNGGDGFTLNGIIYSTFTACAADSNTYAAYNVHNANGIVFDGCGCESNQRDGWFFGTSNSSSTGIPTASQNIRGVVLNGCVGLFNSVASAGTYGTFVRATTSDSRPIDLMINGGSCSESVTGNVGLIFGGYGGSINVARTNVYVGTTYEETLAGVVNQNYMDNGSGSQYYVNDAATTDITHSKTGYSGSGTTYFTNYIVSSVAKGSISYNGTNVVYATTSDYRLKEQDKTLENGLSTVARLRPVSYLWKDSKKEDNGFIAHELQSVIPQAVVGEKDAVDKDGKPVYQAIDSGFIIPYLVAAIQELEAKVKALEAK